MTDTDYHGDKTAVSSSALKLFSKSPAAVQSYFLDQDDDDDAEHFKIGRALHAAVLEPAKFTEKLIRMPEFKGKGSRIEKAAFLGRQKPDAIILNDKSYLQIEGMINSILRHPSGGILNLNDCVAENSIYFRDPDTGIKCKVRPDLWSEKYSLLLDVKTCRDGGARAFSRTINELNYHLSMAMYAYGINLLTGKKPEMCLFIVVEKLPPYEAAFYYCTDRMLEKGYEKYKEAMKSLEKCLKDQKWPQRQLTHEPIDLPAWVYGESQSNELTSY